MRRYSLSIVIAIVAVFLPWINGGLRVAEYAVADPLDHFQLAQRNLYPLLFPFLASLVYAPTVAAEWTNSAWMPMWARAGRSGYFKRHIFRSIAWGFFVFAGVSLMISLITLWVVPGLGLVDYQGAGSIPAPDARFTFSQIFAVGDLWAVLFFALWTGLHAALISLLSTTCVWLVSHRILALAIVPIVEFVLDFVLAVLGIPQFGWVASAFPHNMIQGSVVPPITTFVVLCVVALGLLFRVYRTEV